MGIVFLYYDPDNTYGKYKLIVAHNRDAYLGNPSEPADFWGTDSNIITGKTIPAYATPSTRKFGTSFGIDLRGRFGLCLDILSDPRNDQKGPETGYTTLKQFFDNCQGDLIKSQGKSVHRGDIPVETDLLEPYVSCLNALRSGIRQSEPFQLITGQCDTFYYKCLRNRIKRKTNRTKLDFNDSGYLDELLSGSSLPGSIDETRSLSPPKSKGIHDAPFIDSALSDDNRGPTFAGKQGQKFLGNVKSNQAQHIGLNNDHGWRFDYTNTLWGIQEELEPGTVHGFCDSRLNPHSDKANTEWRKVAEGKADFLQIIHEFGGDLAHFDTLIRKILELMKNQHHFLPDPKMETELTDLNYEYSDIQNRASIFIPPLPTNGEVDFEDTKLAPDLSTYYGTRTINILVIDSKNNVEFLESHLQYPACLRNQVWNPTKFSFNLKIGCHI